MVTPTSEPFPGSSKVAGGLRDRKPGSMMESEPSGSLAQDTIDSEAHLMSMSLPALLLRLEGAAVLGAAVLLYWEHSGSWLLFALLILAPDLSMLGYMAGPNVGTLAYNIVHTTLLPLALAVTGVLIDQSGVVSVGLIWLAHIGVDRMIGYGLKYPEGFKENHLARV